MKNGYMFFLNLGTVTYVARNFLLIIAVVMLYVDGFYQKVIVFAFFLLCLFVSTIKAPSDKDVAREVEFFRTRFKEKIGETGHTYSMNGVKVLEAYRVKGKMKMRRTVGYDIVYPYLVSVAVARGEKRTLMLYVDELCLLKRGDAVFDRCVVDANTLKVTTKIDEEDNEVVCVTLECPLFENRIELIAKNDFHYREFMDMVGSINNDN